MDQAYGLQTRNREEKRDIQCERDRPDNISLDTLNHKIIYTSIGVPK